MSIKRLAVFQYRGLSTRLTTFIFSIIRFAVSHVNDGKALVGA